MTPLLRVLPETSPIMPSLSTSSPSATDFQSPGPLIPSQFLPSKAPAGRIAKSENLSHFLGIPDGGFLPRNEEIESYSRSCGPPRFMCPGVNITDSDLWYITLSKTCASKHRAGHDSTPVTISTRRPSPGRCGSNQSNLLYMGKRKRNL